jgi:glutamate--cysteine ligase
MTAQKLDETQPAETQQDVFLTAADPVEAARQHLAETTLRADAGGRVGLELEHHLVDLADPGRRPTWDDVTALKEQLGAMPAGSAVTFEPGGQIELSSPPAAGLVEAVAALRTDVTALRAGLRVAGYGAAGLGSDLARTPRRINPHTRYRAMEQHFDALGFAGSGMEMMTATAALQVNLDAGPASGWQARLGLVRTMVPMLVAASSTSPWLGGRTSGWHSMRQGTWQGIDHGRSDPVPLGDPVTAWATYALEAPVMLVRDGESLAPVTERIPFAQWLRGAARGRSPFTRPPTTADLDYHLTTLFPPVRPRGYLELRCLDALPDRWWPALAAITVTLVDDPVAAGAAADLCASVTDSWDTAARHGLADEAIRRAVTGCVEVALRHCPPALKPEVEAYAALLDAGSSPSQELRRRIEAIGPLAVLEEEAHGLDD